MILPIANIAPSSSATTGNRPLWRELMEAADSAPLGQHYCFALERTLQIIDPPFGRSSVGIVLGNAGRFSFQREGIPEHGGVDQPPGPR
jgi:hypothetical protein